MATDGIPADELSARARALATAERLPALERGADGAERELEATHRTLSWRVGAPLRRARQQVARVRPLLARLDAKVARTPITPRLGLPASEHRPASGAPTGSLEEPDRASVFADRLVSVCHALAPDTVIERPLHRFSELAASLPSLTAAWLGWVAARADYPTETQLERAALRVELGGIEALAGWMAEDVAAQERSRGAPARRLRLARDAVLIDVTMTATQDVHTGVQRVVREVGERWLRRPDVFLVSWDADLQAPRAIVGAEVDYFLSWRDRTDKPPRVRAPVTEADDLLLPWKATVVIPEIAIEPARIERLRALGRAGCSSGSR